jgi:hypothetical protein
VPLAKYDSVTLIRLSTEQTKLLTFNTMQDEARRGTSLLGWRSEPELLTAG